MEVLGVVWWNSGRGIEGPLCVDGRVGGAVSIVESLDFLLKKQCFSIHPHHGRAEPS